MKLIAIISTSPLIGRRRELTLRLSEDCKKQIAQAEKARERIIEDSRAYVMGRPDNRSYLPNNPYIG